MGDDEYWLGSWPMEGSPLWRFILNEPLELPFIGEDGMVLMFR
ncbi:hypothetical protein QG37_01397 [Candidozyma auris]|uniref:Uncharacterized protein n=1 Tax=Candidozyma auris TaxID=498019 RepID=A0A0L0P5S0_CANAR|nr:hypothetical protein QG37_01397 [[Candida] auris]